ncbi:hypothetical protein Tco_0765419 [Tanacetum coccineum]
MEGQETNVKRGNCRGNQTTGLPLLVLATVRLRWLRDMEQTFESCNCDEQHKVKYAVRMLKGRALDWLRKDIVPKETFLKSKRSSLFLKKRNGSIEKYSSAFIEKLCFAGCLTPDEETQESKIVEDDIALREEENKSASKKRKWEGSTGSSKKANTSLVHSRRDCPKLKNDEKERTPEPMRGRKIRQKHVVDHFR